MRSLRLAAVCLLGAAALLSASCSPIPASPVALETPGGPVLLRPDARLPEGKTTMAVGEGRASLLCELDKPVKLGEAHPALEIRYTLSGSAKVELFAGSPRGKPFLAAELAKGPGEIRWTVPLPPGSSLAALRFSVLPPDGAPGSSSTKTEPSKLEILGLAAREAEYGFLFFEGGARFSRGAAYALESGGAATIRVEHPYAPESSMAAEIHARKGTVRLSSEGGGTAVLNFERRGTALVPLAALGGRGALTAQARETDCLEGLVLKPPEALESPSALDLGTILALPPPPDGESPYRLFRWDVLPDTLVFDFRDYATQDRYLKRLAFFVEKEGYRGRLAADAEIANLHGWNAHDYRPQDLAAFFGKAERTGFTLSPEERELLKILEDTGVLTREGGALKSGKGAFISISRESDRYFRRLFINHEASHALFFQDERYRALAQSRWRALSEPERRFWNVFLSNRDYDPFDAYLSYNEFQAYMTQQSPSQLEDWLKNVAYARLAKSYPDRAQAILDDLSAALPGFAEHAAALDSYLRENYGLRAGSFERVRFE